MIFNFLLYFIYVLDLLRKLGFEDECVKPNSFDEDEEEIPEI